MTIEGLDEGKLLKALENRFNGLDERTDRATLTLDLDRTTKAETNISGTGVVLDRQKFRSLSATRGSWWLTRRLNNPNQTTS